MKHVSKMLVVLALSCGAPFIAVAADNASHSAGAGKAGSMDHSQMGNKGHGAPSASGASTGGHSSAAMVPAEVRKVDKEQGKVTLKHGPLPNLDMPAMTMVFRVKDPSMLDQVKPGDKVSFMAEKVNGTLTVTMLEPAQ